MCIRCKLKVYFRANRPSSSSEIMNVTNDNIENTQEAAVNQAAELQPDEWWAFF